MIKTCGASDDPNDPNQDLIGYEIIDGEGRVLYVMRSMEGLPSYVIVEDEAGTYRSARSAGLVRQHQALVKSVEELSNESE